jgi:hypothetical protein
MTGQATADNLRIRKAIPLGDQLGDPLTATGDHPEPPFEPVFLVTV